MVTGMRPPATEFGVIIDGERSTQGRKIGNHATKLKVSGLENE
jgi:hypothetical protein